MKKKYGEPLISFISFIEVDTLCTSPLNDYNADFEKGWLVD